MAVDTPTRVASPAGPGETIIPPSASRRRKPPWRNPWRHAWFLEGFTWLYLIWSIVPIGLAVLFSFNKGKSQSAWQGFSLRWYITDPVNSVLQGSV
jgi:spermidine/putrescine transport system permease protein